MRRIISEEFEDDEKRRTGTLGVVKLIDEAIGGEITLSATVFEDGEHCVNLEMHDYMYAIFTADDLKAFADEIAIREKEWNESRL